MTFDVYFDYQYYTVEADNEIEAACNVTGDNYDEVIANCDTIDDYIAVWLEAGKELEVL